MAGRKEIRNRAIRLMLLLLLSLLLGGNRQFKEEEIKAAYIERFTRFIEWPYESIESSEKEEFVISIIGSSPVGKILQNRSESIKIKGLPLRVRENIGIQDFENSDILFISSDMKNRVSSIISKSEDLPILTIGDTPGFAEAGIMINFYKRQDRILFEMNLTSSAFSGIKIGSRLSNLARIVE